MSANMTAELLVQPVIGERHAAVGAAGDIAAEGTLQGRGITPPIEKQYRLLAALQSLSERLLKLRREDWGPFAFAHALTHINDTHHWHSLLIRPFRQLQQPVFSALAIVITF